MTNKCSIACIYYYFVSCSCVLGMATVEKRKPATRTGPTKQLPDKQLLRILEHFVAVLESEKLVFSHNLGVHSGTAVIEDLVARKLWELCNKAHTLITMKDKCMEVFLNFCEGLTAEQRNRMLTAFSVFDKGDLLDYVQLVKPHLVKDAITAPLSSTGVNSGTAWASLTDASSPVVGNSNRAGVQVFKKSAPFVSRVEALRKAGHPFLKIVDKIIEDKHTQEEARRDPGLDDILVAIRDGTVTDMVAAQMHIMLRSNLAARKKWLAGMPLHQALLESASSPFSHRSIQTATPRTPTPPTISENREYSHAEKEKSAEHNSKCMHDTAGLTPENNQARMGPSRFLPCVVHDEGPSIVLEFSTGDVLPVDLPILRRSSVLKELEQADGQTVQLDAQHIRHWLYYIDHGGSYFKVEELVDALKAADFLVDEIAIDEIATELALRIAERCNTPALRQQIIEQLPHPNLVEAVLQRACVHTDLLHLLTLLPEQLHPAVLTAFAPSITRCHSLRLPHNENQVAGSLCAMQCAASFTFLTSLELYHSKSWDVVGPSDGICALPSDLQLPDTCLYQESNSRRFWDSMKDACDVRRVDELVQKLLNTVASMRSLRSFTITCSVVGCAVTEGLARLFLAGSWPHLNHFYIQDCSTELNPVESSKESISRAMEHIKSLQAKLAARPSTCTQHLTMQDVPELPEAIATAICDGYYLQIQRPEAYRCNKFTMQAATTKGSLKTLHMYECNLTVRAVKRLAAVISRSPRLETVHVCQAVMVFIRQPLLEGLVAQLQTIPQKESSSRPASHAGCSDWETHTTDQVSTSARLSDSTEDSGPSAPKRLRYTHKNASDTPAHNSSSKLTANKSAHTVSEELPLDQAPPDGSLQELHILGHEYSSCLDVDAVFQCCETADLHDSNSTSPLQEPPALLLKEAQEQSTALLQHVILGNPQLRSLRLDSWDEDSPNEKNACRFWLTEDVLNSLRGLTNLQCLGLNLHTLCKDAGRAIADAISPSLRMMVMHLDHDGDSESETQFMRQLAPKISSATGITSLELPCSVPHDCSLSFLIPRMSSLTNLTRLRIASIGDVWVPADPCSPKSLMALARVLQNMPLMLQLELPLLSACNVQSMKALMDSVSKCTKLEALEILACSCIDSARLIPAALMCTTRLRHLKLEHCKFADLSSAALPSLPKAIQTLYKLESLVLKTSWIPDSLALDMENSICGLPNLQSLDMRCPPGANTVAYAQDVVLSMHKLTSLVNLQIQSRAVSVDALGCALSHLGCVEGLFITLPNQLNCDNVHMLLMSMIHLPLATLSLDYLRGCSCGKDVETVAHTLKQFPLLSHVVLTAFVPDKEYHKEVSGGWDAAVQDLRCWFFAVV